MKRGSNGHEGNSNKSQEPSLDRESFAVGYAVSSTQGFIHDFAGSVQVSPSILANRVAEFLQSQGSGIGFRPVNRMPGLFRQAAAGDQTVEQMALAERALRNSPSLPALENGNGRPRRRMSAAAKKRIGDSKRKWWKSQGKKVTSKKATGKTATRAHGFWAKQITALVSKNPLSRIELQNKLHQKLGGEKSPIYPAVAGAIRTGLLVPGEDGTYRINEQTLSASA